MKVSLIVAVYKDIEALDLIVKSLKTQTYKNFELIVAEDNNSKQIKEYIDTIKDIEVKHTFQDDSGIRKMKSLNNGILASSGEYLIFIDGDCIPYSTFIESHLKLSQKNYIVSGRRVNLGPKYSTMLREDKISSFKLEKSFLLRFFDIVKDSTERHLEEGFYFHPNSFFYKYILKNRKSSTTLLGCNYSCFKNDMIEINGYDEGYGETAVGDDTDIQWRFQAIGLKIKSAKNIANQFHLYHGREFRKKIPYNNELELMQKNKTNNLYKCKQGLSQH